MEGVKGIYQIGSLNYAVLYSSNPDKALSSNLTLTHTAYAMPCHAVNKSTKTRNFSNSIDSLLSLLFINSNITKT
jgi:hypothetical protein